MTGATTQGGTLQLVATATGSTLAAFNQHQMKADPARGNTRRGVDRLTPAVVHDNVRDWMASRHAGFLRDDLPYTLKTCPGLRGSGLSHSRSDARTSRCCVRKRVCLVPPGQTRAYSLRLADCSPLLRDSLAHKQVVQAVAYGPHLSRLSSGCSVREVSCATKGLANVRKAFGEIRNV